MNLSDIGKLYSAEGPFVSVYADATSAVENASAHYETTWTNVERELAAAGADPATIDAISAARGEHSEGNTRVVIGAGGKALLATSLPEHPAQPVTAIAPLPHVVPLVDALNRVRPHVVTLIDRTGADVFAYTGDALPEEFALVEGDAPDVRKVHGAGGWAMRRMQARAEEGWKHNAKEIAAVIEQVARDISATLVIAAGDTREIEIVHAELGKIAGPLAERFERISGGRAEDGSTEHVFEQVAERVDEWRTKDAIALLDQFAGNRGRGEYAADGLAEVVGALRRAQVDTLLVTEDYDGSPGSADELWFGPDPSQLATSREELESMGVRDPQQGNALDALLRTAIATGALYLRVPGGTEQSPAGVGATLRFSLES